MAPVETPQWSVRTRSRPSLWGPWGAGEDAETFSREYVERLRAEAAEARVRAKRADEAEERLRGLALADAVRGLLMDPSDLGWDETYVDENGWPDHDKILAAAEELVARRPHLARPRGDVGLGRRGEPSDDVSLVGIMSQNA
ncbi:hypothetical protein [Janibacter melonis]|uniref:hypothetical protein n=1 Tax=Janibacter melonis TaxID=262209 RepID=UPI0020949C16|nr:hypothetical protein [Janibacter melonis]